MEAPHGGGVERQRAGCGKHAYGRGEGQGEVSRGLGEVLPLGALFSDCMVGQGGGVRRAADNALH